MPPVTLSKALLHRGRLLPVNECLELGLTLNLALGHLHRAGLIHRDIKPSNIIFVGGVPKLADIGLVIETSEARSYVGTEGFIPPEGPTCPQADLYSLGKVLYEASMGKDRKDFPEPFTQIADAPDSEQLLEFNAILLKACAANVKDRYPSAEAMNADLALLQSGGSVRRQRKLAGQLHFVQRAGVAVTVLAALIAAGWLWQARQTHLVRELVGEKTILAEQNRLIAEEKTRLAEENRQRVMRLDVANGVQRLDNGDPSAALLWFVDALRLATNDPAEESIHRIRFQQALEVTPRLVQAVGFSSTVGCAAISPDNRCVVAVGNHEWGATSGESRVCLWDVRSGQPRWTNSIPGRMALRLRFDADGKRVFVSTYGLPSGNHNFENMRRDVAWTAVLDAATGAALFPPVDTDHVTSAFSPDDRWLAIAHTNRLIEVLDTRDGSRVASLAGHTNNVVRWHSLRTAPVSPRAAKIARSGSGRCPMAKR